MRKTAKMTAKKMLSKYMGRATPNGMDPREAARLSVKVCEGLPPHMPHIICIAAW